MGIDTVEVLYVENEFFLKVGDDVVVKFNEEFFITNIEIIRNKKTIDECSYLNDPVKFCSKKHQSGNIKGEVKRWVVKMPSRSIKTIYCYNESVYVFTWDTNKSSRFLFTAKNIIKIPLLLFYILGDILTGKSGSGGGLQK